MFVSSRNLGEDSHFDKHIFSKGVETNRNGMVEKSRVFSNDICVDACI